MWKALISSSEIFEDNFNQAKRFADILPKTLRDEGLMGLHFGNFRSFS